MDYEMMVKEAYEEIMSIEKEAGISDILINNSSFSQAKPGGTMAQTVGKNLTGEVKNMFGREQKLMGQAGINGISNGPIAKSIRKHVYNNPGSSELRNRISGLKKDGVSFRDMSRSLSDTFKTASNSVSGLWKSNISPSKPNVPSSLVGAGADAKRKLQSSSYLSDLRKKERAGFSTKKPNTFWNDMF